MSLIEIVDQLGGLKNYGFDFSNAPTTQVVARIIERKNNKDAGYINMNENSTNRIASIDTSTYLTEPVIPLNKERIAIIISGESGTGKSTLGAMFLQQYEAFFPERPLYLISQKDKNIDRNLKTIKNLNQFTDEEINEFDINNYSDSIFLFDDSDFGKNSKKVFDILNLVSTVGREYRTSFIFITHFNSRLNATKAYSEFQIYITFNDNLLNNRMLETHMSINKKDLEALKNVHSAYYVFNKIYNIVITDKKLIKY